MSFSLFRFLPAELQLSVFEHAINNLLKPRIVLLDIATTPYFDPMTHGVTLGWAPTVLNHLELHHENPIQLAHTLINHTCPTGARVGRQFLDTISDVSYPPQHCQALQGLNLSLWADVFWLPNDLLRFLEARATAPSHPFVRIDEEKIRRLMLGLETTEKILAAWAT